MGGEASGSEGEAVLYLRPSPGPGLQRQHDLSPPPGPGLQRKYDPRGPT